MDFEAEMANVSFQTLSPDIVHALEEPYSATKVLATLKDMYRTKASGETRWVSYSFLSKGLGCFGAGCDLDGLCFFK